MADVFISYARPERAAAERLARYLKESGYTVFFDANIVTAEDWSSRIETELTCAKAAVVLWSKVSRDRVWVRNEAAMAKRLGTLIPARLDDCHLPLEFSHLQTADLSWLQSAQSVHSVEALLIAIERLVYPFKGRSTTQAIGMSDSGSHRLIVKELDADSHTKEHSPDRRRGWWSLGR